MTKSEASSAPTGKNSNSTYGSLAAIRASTASTQLIDILLTNAFPAHATAFSLAPLPSPSFPPSQSEPVAEVVRRTKPRYHFVAGGGTGEGHDEPPMFWEREPIVWAEEGGRVTRLVSLGAFGAAAPEGGKKQRVCLYSIITAHDRVNKAKMNGTVVLRVQHRAAHADLATAASSRQRDAEPVHRAPRRDGDETAITKR